MLKRLKHGVEHCQRSEMITIASRSNNVGDHDDTWNEIFADLNDIHVQRLISNLGMIAMVSCSDLLC
jgi:hypothetical protein